MNSASVTDPRPASAAASPPGRLHLAHVEGLRAVAALTVFVNHAYAQTWAEWRNENATGALSVFKYSMIAGHLAVAVFIVISGFCLTLPVVDGGEKLRGGVVKFFERRARRILPPYYGALLLSLALIATVIGKPTGTLWDEPIQADWRAVVCHFVLVQDFFRTGLINYVFWSIAVEWHLYFVFPLLVWAARRFGIVRVAGAALVVGYAIRFAGDGTRVVRANPHFIGLFALGMLAAYVVRSPRSGFTKVKDLTVWAWVGGAALAVVATLCVVWDVPGSEPRFHYLDFPVGVLAACVLVHTSGTRERLLTRFLRVRPLAFVGTFSYSVYLIHAPLLQIIWQYALHPLGVSPDSMFVLLMTLGLACVLTVSYAFFRVCEEPFMGSSARDEARRQSARIASAA
ncbi:MAG TPA: acyltransferase [Polyangiaceae bacterium]|nr:acyltransferase [Polyangiaceae bacterium]